MFSLPVTSPAPLVVIIDNVLPRNGQYNLITLCLYNNHGEVLNMDEAALWSNQFKPMLTMSVRCHFDD